MTTAQVVETSVTLSTTVIFRTTLIRTIMLRNLTYSLNYSWAHIFNKLQNNAGKKLKITKTKVRPLHPFCDLILPFSTEIYWRLS